jgi:hypothetical protein
MERFPPRGLPTDRRPVDRSSAGLPRPLRAGRRCKRDADDASTWLAPSRREKVSSRPAEAGGPLEPSPATAEGRSLRLAQPAHQDPSWPWQIRVFLMRDGRGPASRRCRAEPSSREEPGSRPVTDPIPVQSDEGSLRARLVLADRSGRRRASCWQLDRMNRSGNYLRLQGPLAWRCSGLQEVGPRRSSRLACDHGDCGQC